MALERVERWKITVLGDGGVGKTALSMQVIQSSPSSAPLLKLTVFTAFVVAYATNQFMMRYFIGTFIPTILPLFRKLTSLFTFSFTQM
jgi:GTPase SAR1 family protein